MTNHLKTITSTCILIYPSSIPSIEEIWSNLSNPPISPALLMAYLANIGPEVSKNNMLNIIIVDINGKNSGNCA